MVSIDSSEAAAASEIDSVIAGSLCRARRTLAGFGGLEQGVDLGDLSRGERTARQGAGLFLGLGNRPDAGQCDCSVRPAPYVSDGALDEGAVATCEDVTDQVDPFQPLCHPVVVEERPPRSIPSHVTRCQ